MRPVDSRYVHRLALKDKWEADREAALKSCGVEKADAVSGKALKVEDRALERLSKCKARTPHGIMLKLIAVDIWANGNWPCPGVNEKTVISAIADARRFTGLVS